MKKNYHLLNIIFIVILILPVFLFASWFKIHEDPSFGTLYDAFSFSYNLTHTYAVGSDGWLYITDDQGHNWQQYQLVPDKDLNAVGFGQNSDSSFIFACGEDGAFARFYEPDNVWITINNLTANNLNSIQYNYSRSETWVAGDSNYIAISRDAFHWNRIDVPEPVMDIKGIYFSYENAVLFGNDERNLYIHFLRALPDSAITDNFLLTWQNYQLIAIAKNNGEFSPDIVFLTENLQSGEFHIMSLNIYDPEPQVKDLGVVPVVSPLSIGTYVNTNTYVQYYWVGNSAGEILRGSKSETENTVSHWNMVYQDVQQRGIYTFISGEQNDMRGMALGEDGLVLLNSFQVTNLEPKPCQVVTSPYTSFRIRFSAIPNLSLLSTHTFPFSNYSGLLPFTVSYDLMDSTVAVYQINREQPSSSIPGETWNIGLGLGIYALGDTSGEINLKPMQYTFSFAQMKNSSFQYQAAHYLPNEIKNPSTNYAIGFFNRDNMLDLITYSQGKLYCYHRYRVTPDSMNLTISTISFPDLITTEKPIYHQLLTANINNDDLPDLIIYDSYGIHFLINQSAGANINFSLATASYSGQNIRQVVAYNDNNNAQTDLLVLSNNLTLVYDIQPETSQFNETTLFYNAEAIEKICVGNVDDDPAQDLVMADNGKILYRMGDFQYGLASGSVPDTLTSDNEYFYNVKLANLDNDDRLEIVAQSLHGLQVIPIYHNVVIGPTQNSLPNHLIDFNPNAEPPSDFILQDFGGDPSTENMNAVDLAILQEDSLFIYQNLTTATSNIVFSSQPVFKMSLGSPDFPDDRLAACDYDMQETLNILVSDYETGTMTILGRLQWQPTLQIESYNAYHVRLHWNYPPPEVGTLQYFRIIKKVMNDSIAQNITVDNNYFTDTDVRPYTDYSYAVQAVYTDGQVSELSDPVYVSTYYELNGQQSGVLADTTLPYWAKSNLEVYPNDSLIIMPGIQIEFSPGTGFDINGKFRAIGDSSHMVEFSARDSLWNGMSFLNSADTANMVWFSISDANIAIHSIEQPFKLRFCGLIKNKTALQAEKASFFMENAIIDSCEQGIMALGNSEGHLKNIDVLHTLNHSIYATGTNTKIWIRNAIIWDNLQPVTANAPAQILLRYSTVDSLGEGATGNHIFHLAPVFNLDDPDTPFIIDPMSPTIDAGDPKDDFSFEPQPNGGRINQGVFGNSPFATPSFQPRGKVFTLKAHLKCFPNNKDSTSVFVKNWGYVPLNIESISLLHSGENGPFFTKYAELNQGIPAQDSLEIKLLFQPAHRGNFSDSLIVICNDPHLEQGQMFLAVSGQGLNSRPQIVNVPPTQAYVDSPYVFVPEITDADGDSVVVTPLLKPEWLTWDNGKLQGTPTISDTGANPVRLKFDDLFGGTDTLSFVINVQYNAAQLVIYPLLNITPVGGLTSTQAAMRFRLSVFDSTENWVKEATDTYRMHVVVHQVGGADTIRFDTTGVKELTFTRLKDGIYSASIFIHKIFGGKLLAKKATIKFTIKASAKTTNRFLWIMASLPRTQSFDLKTLHLNDSSAVLFRWNPETEKYDLLNDSQLLPGHAFWIMPLKVLSINLNPFAIASQAEMPEQQTAPHFDLQPGWNQIGLSLPYFERWIDCRISGPNGEISWQEAFQDSLISPAVYWFEQSPKYIGYHPEAIDSNTVAIPWRGYWMFSTAQLTVYFPEQPYFPKNEVHAAKPSSLMKVKGDQNAYLMNLTVASGSYKDDYNIFGLSAVKTAKLPEPPYFRDFAALSFGESGHAFCKDVKTIPQETNAVVNWNVTLQTTQPDKRHHLQWTEISLSNEPVYLYLVDSETETVINMNEKSEYDLTPGKTKYTFKIYASKDDHFKPSVIPLQYKLTQNYPNPFNPSTTIRVGIPESGKNQRVSLKIYDVLGKNIKTLVDGFLQPGYHKFEWDGTNMNGNPVSSGIYFYQMQAGRTTIMHKMILLR